MSFRRAFLPLLLSATTFVAVARAEPSSADVESARQLFRQGNELRAANDLRGALARYKAAHALAGTPITGFEVGRTHVQLGELVEGFAALTSVAKIPTKPNESANTTSARTEAEKMAREIEPKIPSIRVLVNANGAIVQLDGKSVAPSVATKVNPGKHVVVVQANGSSKTSEVIVAEAEARDVEVAFASPAPVPTPPIVAPPPDETPVRRIEAGRPTWIWVGFGVAGAGVIAGAVTGIITLNGTKTLADRCPGGNCPPSEHDQLKSTERWATVSTISFAVAGAAAVVSIVGLLVTPSRQVETGAIRPMIGLGSIGLEGSF
jgi:hypothetical protein